MASNKLHFTLVEREINPSLRIGSGSRVRWAPIRKAGTSRQPRAVYSTTGRDLEWRRWNVWSLPVCDGLEKLTGVGSEGMGQALPAITNRKYSECRADYCSEPGYFRTRWYPFVTTGSNGSHEWRTRGTICLQTCPSNVASPYCESCFFWFSACSEAGGGKCAAK